MFLLPSTRDYQSETVDATYREVTQLRANREAETALRYANRKPYGTRQTHLSVRDDYVCTGLQQNDATAASSISPPIVTKCFVLQLLFSLQSYVIA